MLDPFRFLRRASPGTVLVLLVLGGPSHAGEEPSPIPARTVVDSTATFPLELGRGQPVVEVMLNGKGPFRMFLDTGAGATVLNDDLAHELGLAVLDTTRIGDPVNPHAILGEVVELATIELGTARFEGVRAVSWDRSTLRPGTDPPRGVVGIGVFHDVLLTLDYPRKRGRITRGELPEADGERVLDYTSPHGIPVIPVVISGRTYRAHIDSGSPGGFLLPLAEKDSVSVVGELKVIGQARTVNSTLTLYAGELADSARIGGHVFAQPSVMFNDALPDANIGGRVLAEFAMTLDQKNRRVRFDRAEQP